MHSLRNSKLYLTGQIAEYFENNPTAMCLFDEGVNEVVAFNRAYIENECFFSYFLSSWESKYLASDKQELVLVDYDGQEAQFITTALEGNISLVQVVMVSPAFEAKKNLQKDAVHQAAGQFSFQDQSRPLPFCPERFIKLAEIAPLGIIITNQDFEILWNNQKSIDLFGRKKLLESNFLDAIYIKNIADFWFNINESKEKERAFNFNFTIKNLKSAKELFIKCSGITLQKVGTNPDGFVFLLKDNTENTYFSEEIRERNLELNQINHELDKFLYSVSHNIRGPVASLEGLLKVIQISDVEAVNQLKHHLRLNLRLLNAFVQDISNIATNIHTHVKNEPINLFNMAEELLLFMENIYELNAIKQINIPVNYCVNGDADRLAMVLKGILKNSFQYRDSRKSDLNVSITVIKNDDFHLIEIEDNGIGIADEVKPRIFDMFYRGTELSTGNGMGLHNTREILKKIGGTMNIESRNGKWTRAKVYLPVNPQI